MTAVAINTGEMMAVDSIVLGPLSVATTSVFQFPAGLHGFEEHKQFVLIPAARDALFWLQSLADRNIAFLMVDPFVVSDGYEVDLGPVELTTLRLNDPGDALVLAIVTLPVSQGALPTANLRGPIVFNSRERIGQQVVSARDDRDLRTPIDLNDLPRRAEGIAAL